MRSLAALGLLLATLQGCGSTSGGSPVVRAEAERLEPITLVALGPELQESSGLARVGSTLWSMNDSGGESQLSSYDLQAKQFGAVALAGAVNFDWEAMAQSDTHLFVVDCGNNRGDRIWLQLYQIELSQLGNASVDVQRRDFRWGDVEYGVKRRAHNNDCEAAAWVDNELWLFTKNWQDQATRLYRMRPSEDRQQLLSSERFAVDGLITGADYSAEHQTLALIGYGKGLRVLQPFVWLVPVEESALVWSQAKRYLIAKSGQWEAIVWQDADLLISREESVLGGAQFARIRLPQAALTN